MHWHTVRQRCSLKTRFQCTLYGMRYKVHTPTHLLFFQGLYSHPSLMLRIEAGFLRRQSLVASTRMDNSVT